MYDRAVAVYLVGSSFDDSIVEHLATLKNLEYVSLSGTTISDDGLAKLRSALPNVQVNGTQFASVEPAQAVLWHLSRTR